MRYYADAYNVHARIYAVKSRLFTRADYVSLIREQESSRDKVSTDEGMIRVKEEVFRKEIGKVLQLAQAVEMYEPLFLAFLRRYEVNNVKLILAKIFGRPSVTMWYDIGDFAIIDRDLLMKDVSIGELEKICSDTGLEGLFAKKVSYAHLEIRIDLLTMKNMIAASASFHREVGDVFRTFIKKRIAVLLALRRVRLKRTYHIHTEKIALDERAFSEIFEESFEPQVKIVEKELLGRIAGLEKSGVHQPEVPDIEYYLEDYFYQWVLSMFHKDFHAPYCVISYLWLLAYQIRNLFCIVEGVRFGLSQEAIVERIISEA